MRLLLRLALPLFGLPLLAPAVPVVAQQRANLTEEQRIEARRTTIVAAPVAVMIGAFDGDGDAVVTRAEFDAGVRRAFQAGAGGGDMMGYIAFGDWAKRWLGDAAALPSPFETDRNGDNRITAAEFELRFDLLFAEYDKDKDGTITRAELLTIRTPFGMDRDGRRMRRDR